MDFSPEFIAKIKLQLEKEKRYDRLRQEAEELNSIRKEELVDLVNSILVEEKCPLITKDQIQFYPQYIGNTGIGMPIDKGLTKIIYDYYFPLANDGIYAHFTDLAAFESILKNQKIRLTSTIKRKSQLEFKLFYEVHDIEGYKRPSEDSTSDEQLMKDLFYLSLTENTDSTTDLNRGLWNHFGKKGTGVKLLLNISTEHSDFRHVYYPESSFSQDKLLVQKLNDRLMSTFGKPLVFNSISKIGAFYIHSNFEGEYETRFLIKRHSDDYPFPFTIQYHESIPYIELDLVSPWGSFLPIKVQPGVNCDRSAVQQIVDASGLTLEVLPSALSL